MVEHGCEKSRTALDRRGACTTDAPWTANVVIGGASSRAVRAAGRCGPGAVLTPGSEYSVGGPPLRDVAPAKPDRESPSFEDADVQMWDTNSIMRYVCTKHELEQWLPSSPERRALCELGLDFSTVVADTLTKLAHADLGYGLATMALDTRATLLERAGGEVFPTLDALIRSAGSGGFVGGASPCIADLAIGIALEYARAALDEGLSPLVWPPSLVAYLERMRGALGDAVFSTAVEPMIAAASRAKASAAKTRA